MKKYSKYRDSGVEWLGEIPEHWGIKKVKHLTTKIGSGVTPKGGAEVYQTSGIPLLRSQNVHFTGLKLDDVAYISEQIHASMANSEVSENDVLLNITGASIGRCYYVNSSILPANVNQHVCILRPNDEFEKEYLYFLLSSAWGQFLIDYCQNGANREGLNFEQIKNFNMPIPSRDERRAISEFLAQRTSQIDSLIEKKRRMVELLKEERAAIINKAVTKGINPDAEMKDSGIEWLGEVPKHWELKKLRYVGDCQNGISAGAEYFGSGYPFVTYGDVYNNFVLPFIGSGLANSSPADRETYSVQKGDVFFTRTSETVEEIGFAATCVQTMDNGTFSGFLIRFRPREGFLYEGFSTYFFRSEIHRRYFVKEMNLVTRASLGQDLLKRMPILLPPLSEQKVISKWLDTELGRIDGLISKFQKELSLIDEYRMALINEAVTGKIDVREKVLS